MSSCHRRPAQVWALCLGVILVASACSDSPEFAGPSSPQVTQIQPSPSQDVEAVSLTPYPWEVAFGPRTDGLIVQDIDQGRILYDHWGPVDGTTELTRVIPGEAPQGTTLPADRRIQQAKFLGEDVVYSVTSDGDPSVFEILWWPSSGQTPVVFWDAAAQGSSYSEIVVRDQFLYFARQNRGAMCLSEATVLHGELATHQDVACTETGEVLWWLRGSDDGTVSYLVAPSMSDDCSRLFRWSPGNEVPSLVDTGGCVSRGAADARTAVWSTSPRVGSGGALDWSATDLYVLRDDEPTALGSGAAGTLIPCGEAVYWTVEPTEGAPAEIRRWTPDQGVHAVFRSPRDSAGWDKFSLSRPECMGGEVGFHRIDTSGYLSVEYLTAEP